MGNRKNRQGELSSDTHLLNAASVIVFPPKPNSSNSSNCHGELRWAAYLHSWRTDKGAWVFFFGNWPGTALPRSLWLLAPALTCPLCSGQTIYSLHLGFGCWAALSAHSEGFPFPDPLSLYSGFHRAVSGVWVWAVLLGWPPDLPPPPVSVPTLVTTGVENVP